MIAVMETKRKEENPDTWRAGVKPIHQPKTKVSTGLDYIVFIQLKDEKSVYQDFCNFLFFSNQDSSLTELFQDISAYYYLLMGTVKLSYRLRPE